MNEIQKIKSVLIPEIGLELEPEYVKESETGSAFQRSLAHLVGRTGNRSIILKATSDGRLIVSAAGTALEVYTVNNGVGADAYAAGDTFVFADAQYVTDILVETFPAQISWRNAALLWGADKSLPVGAYSFDLNHYGIRVQNRTPGSNTVYEITTYR